MNYKDLMSIVELEPREVHAVVLGWPTIEATDIHSVILKKAEYEFGIEGFVETIEKTFDRAEWVVGKLSDDEKDLFFDLTVGPEDNCIEVRYFPYRSWFFLKNTEDGDLNSFVPYSPVVEYCTTNNDIIYFKFEYNQYNSHQDMVLAISLIDGSHAWHKKKPHKNRAKKKLPLFPQL